METAEVERLRRHLRAFSGKVDDPESFATLVGLAEEFDALLAERARDMATAGPRPYTWQEIARPLGISKQAAWRKYTAKR
jgi:hypothetical protein